MRRIGLAALALACWWLTGSRAQEVAQPEARDPAAPDLDFLEYLGTWAEEDDEWVAIEQWRKDNAADTEKDAKESESERDDDDESK